MARRGRRDGCLRGRFAAILRIVQSGLGIRGTSWADVVRESPNVEPAGTPVYGTVEEALAGVACGAVLVATPTLPTTLSRRPTLGRVRSVEKNEMVDIEPMIAGMRREARPAGR